MTRLRAASLLLTLALSGCLVSRAPASPARSTGATQPDAFDLRGTVRDEATQQPLSGVKSVVESSPERAAITDRTGGYRVSGLPLGTYMVSARAIGHYVERREVGVSCPVVIEDSVGRPIAGGGDCDSDQPVLNFFMRGRTLR